MFLNMKYVAVLQLDGTRKRYRVHKDRNGNRYIILPHGKYLYECDVQGKFLDI